MDQKWHNHNKIIKAQKHTSKSHKNNMKIHKAVSTTHLSFKKYNTKFSRTNHPTKYWKSDYSNSNLACQLHFPLLKFLEKGSSFIPLKYWLFVQKQIKKKKTKERKIGLWFFMSNHPHRYFKLLFSLYIYIYDDIYFFILIMLIQQVSFI